MSDHELDDAYRRQSALDPSRPSEATRRAIFAEAGRIAAGRRTSRYRPAALGTLAAAALAGLVMFPLLRTPTLRPTATPDSETVVVSAQRRERDAGPGAVAAQSKKREAPAREAPARLAPTFDSAARLQGTTRINEDAPVSEAVQPRAPPLQGAAAPAPRAFAAPSTADAVQPTFGGVAAKATSRDLGAELRTAAAAGDSDRLRALLTQAAAVDATDSAGRTALMLAVEAGRAPAVRLLLAAGANPNAVAADGNTPLRLARQAGDGRIIETLEHAGAR